MMFITHISRSKRNMAHLKPGFGSFNRPTKQHEERQPGNFSQELSETFNLDAHTSNKDSVHPSPGDNGHMQKSTESSKEKRLKRKSTYGQTRDKMSISSQGENVDKGDDGHMQKSTESSKEKRPKRKSTYGPTRDKMSTSSQGENVDKGDDGHMQKSTGSSKEKRPKRKSTSGQTGDKMSTSSQGENVDKGGKLSMITRGFLSEFTHSNPLLSEKRDDSVPMKLYTNKELYRLSTKLSERLNKIEKNAEFIVWPGTDLAKHKTVFVCLYQGDMQKTEQKYKGIHIYYKDSETPSRPFEPLYELPMDIESSLSHKDAELLQQIIMQQGSILFEQHSNLEAITGSSFVLSKSTGYEERRSVVLYCRVKGIAPIGEVAFPKTFTVADEAIKVNVREGYFRQGMYRRSRLEKKDYHEKLCMGISIGVQDGGAGTLGPFVKISDTDVGFLTCSHVILSDPRDQSARERSKNLKVFQPADGESHPDSELPHDVRYCGVVSEILFSPHVCCPKNGLFNPVGVDAALVTVRNRDVDVRSFPFIPDCDLKNAGFDPHDPPTFGHGSVVRYPLDFKNYQGKRVIKYGRTSGLTNGTLSLDGCKIKVSDAKLQLPNNGKFVIMEGQYIVERKGKMPFFQPGDSGSGVFVLDKNNKLTCIGLAIGYLDEWQTVVTPIEYALRALGLGLQSVEFEENMDVQEVPMASTSTVSTISPTPGTSTRKKRKSEADPTVSSSCPPKRRRQK